MSKRFFDIVLATFLVLALLPVLIGIALLVKLTSAGPILFRQQRVGEHGRQFDIYKFRSMRCRSDDLSTPELTMIGRFLRSYSLDELPQLLNVLEGTMSLVGPRPHIVSEHEIYSALIPEYPERHGTKPGMTGLAQVSGFNGPIFALRELQGRLACDLEYLARKSVLFDMRILLRTVPVVIRGRVKAVKPRYRTRPQEKALARIRTAETN